MNSLLCNWFADWGRSIKAGLGSVGIIIFLVAFSCMALFLGYKIIKAGFNKPKIIIKWGHLFFLIILILFIIWFAIIL